MYRDPLRNGDVAAAALLDESAIPPPELFLTIAVREAELDEILAAVERTPSLAHERRHNAAATRVRTRARR
ncbi:hypothetical protein AB0L63_27090 [Nocardia sp. NPDC051990]|uniref:hypothetical protein n=1 Tax=Nocardia sp. NPDC051990 TaxID=3155285 RepID=UPI00341EC5FE